MRRFLALLPALFLAVTLLAQPLAADGVASSGSFVGASNHVTTGGVSVVTNSDGSREVVLAEDFSLDGAPDPRVGLGKSGSYDPGSDLGELASNTGGQSYGVPSALDLDAYDEVYIWCRKFNVPLGVAKLK